MTLSPGIAFRGALIGLVILILAEIALAASAVLVRGKDFGRLSGPILGDQIQYAARLFDTLGPGQRDEALRAMNSPFLRFTLLDVFPEQDLNGPVLPVFVPAIEAFSELLGSDRRFQVYQRMTGGPLIRLLPDRLRMGSMRRQIILVIELRDGAALAVEPSHSYRRMIIMNGMAVAAAVAGLVCLALLIWAALATTRPLERLAESARRFSGDLDTAPVPEEGPRSVRDLARSFNGMRARIHRLVSERTVTMAAIGHDFRTYLTRLRMRAEFMPDAEQRDKAIRDLDDMAALIDNALLLARQTHRGSDGERVDLTGLLGDITARRVDAGSNVTLSGAPDGVSVLGSEASLRRAFDNVIDNAIRYGERAHMEIEVGAQSVRVRIRDEGPGVPEAHLPSLADPFFRVETSRSRDTGGSGLGLAIARTLVEASGGSLSFANHPEGGLQVSIVLPLGTGSKLAL